MSLSKIFMIIFGVPSIIEFDRCGCNYFGIRDMANSDVRWVPLNAGSRKTLVGQVLESRSTVNIPSRGLFYPDDMFFTNWVSSVVNKEDCFADRPSVTTPLDSISKCTQKTKNDEKPTKYKTILRQQKSTFAAENSSSSSRKKSTFTAVRSSPHHHIKSSLSQQQKSTLGHENPTSYWQKSTLGRRMSTRVQKTSAPRLSTPRVQLQASTTSELLQKSSNIDEEHWISTTHIQQQKSTFKIPKNSSSRPQKSSPRIRQKSSGEQQKPMRDDSDESSDATTFPFEYYYPNKEIDNLR